MTLLIWGIPEGFLWDSCGIPGYSSVFLGEPWVFLGGSTGFPGDSCGLPRCFLVLLLFYSKQLGLPGSFLAYLGFQGVSFCDIIDCLQGTYFDNSSKMSSTGLPIQPNSRHFSRSGTQTQSNLPTLARNTRIRCLMNRFES